MQSGGPTIPSSRYQVSNMVFGDLFDNIMIGLALIGQVHLAWPSMNFNWQPIASWSWIWPHLGDRLDTFGILQMIIVNVPLNLITNFLFQISIRFQRGGK